jgi:hypothetical protein
MEQRFFSDHYGFISDYLAEALRSSRRQNYSGAVDEEFAFGEHLNARDERAVRKSVSGLLKILHPHSRRGGQARPSPSCRSTPTTRGTHTATIRSTVKYLARTHSTSFE